MVIHDTAGSSSAGAVSLMRDGAASFHWLVPDEDEPQLTLLRAWHVNETSDGN